MDRVEMHSDYRKSKILEYVDWNDWKRKWNEKKRNDSFSEKQGKIAIAI